MVENIQGTTISINSQPLLSGYHFYYHFPEGGHLRWLKTLSSTSDFDEPFNHSLSLDATVME